MSLESTATYIDSLNIAWPDGADVRSTADDHLRLIKGAVKRTFANVTGAVTATHTDLNQLAGNGSVSFSTVMVNTLNGISASFSILVATHLDAVSASASVLVANNFSTITMSAGSASVSLLYANAVSSPNTSASEPGYKGLPLNLKSADYTCVLADAGKAIRVDNTATITIPANASVAYPSGANGATILTFINVSGGNITIAITSDTLVLAGTSTTGSRTLANNGIATAIKYQNTTWIISGSGLS